MTTLIPKYNFNKDTYSSHTKIINKINKINKINNHKKILDVGCAKGYIGKELRKNNSDIKIIGIDINEKGLKIAKKYYDKIINCDIEKEIPNLKEHYFDIIIYADILEHTNNHYKILKDFNKFLKKNGLVIISVPNIANWYIRLNLLLGVFNYSDIGILDSTHKRFFTLNTIKRDIIKSGLKIIEVDITPIPLPLIIESISEGKHMYFFHRINHFVTKLWKRLFAYQFVITAQK